jgi:CBS domain-containing protein
MKISSILSKKGGEVISIRRRATVQQAIEALAEHNIGALVVLDASGDLVGLISERDIIRTAAKHPEVASFLVSQVMTTDVKKGLPEDDVLSVAHMMTEKRFRHMPVRSQGRLVGIVSIGDILKAQRDEYLGEKDTLETQLMATDD